MHAYRFEINFKLISEKQKHMVLWFYVNRFKSNGYPHLKVWLIMNQVCCLPWGKVWVKSLNQVLQIENDFKNQISNFANQVPSLCYFDLQAWPSLCKATTCFYAYIRDYCTLQKPQKYLNSKRVWIHFKTIPENQNRKRKGVNKRKGPGAPNLAQQQNRPS